jgi:hypothetical protein
LNEGVNEIACEVQLTTAKDMILPHKQVEVVATSLIDFSDEIIETCVFEDYDTVAEEREDNNSTNNYCEDNESNNSNDSDEEGNDNFDDAEDNNAALQQTVQRPSRKRHPNALRRILPNATKFTKSKQLPKHSNEDADLELAKRESFKSYTERHSKPPPCFNPQNLSSSSSSSSSKLLNQRDGNGGRIVPPSI